MSRNVNVVSFSDFRTGLSQVSSIFAEEGNPGSPFYGLRAASEANNVHMSENGLEKFEGFANYLSSAISGTPIVTGLYEYKKRGATTTTYWIVTAGTKVYTASGGSLTEIYSGITAEKYCQFITFNGKVLIMNGTDSVLEYDGTTCTTVTFTDPSTIFGSAKPAFAAIFRNRIFYSGDNTNPSRVWTPRPGSYNNFDNATSTVDAFDVSVGDNDRVTGLLPISKDLLAIYKNGSIHRLSGASPFGASAEPFLLEEVTRDVGCIAPRTLVQVGKDHYFLSQNGLKKLSTVFEYGDVKDADPTYQIQDEIDALNYTESVIQNAFCVYHKKHRHLYLHVPSGSNTQNNKVYVHDIATGGNMPRSGITASCGAIVNRNYYTGTYAGQILTQLSGNNYNDAGIDSEWESKWLVIGSLREKKRFRHLVIYFSTSGRATITVQWKIMNMRGAETVRSKSSESSSGDEWDVGVWNTATWDTGADTIFKANNLGRGRAIKLRIVNNNADEQWRVEKMEVGYQMLGRVAA